MENLLNNEPVKRVSEFIKKFDSNLEVLILNTTARTAKDAADSLKCEVGAIVKSLLFKAENSFLICLIAGDRRCSLNRFSHVFAAAGHPNCVFKITYKKLIKITKGSEKEISE